MNKLSSFCFDKNRESLTEMSKPKESSHSKQDSIFFKKLEVYLAYQTNAEIFFLCLRDLIQTVSALMEPCSLNEPIVD